MLLLQSNKTKNRVISASEREREKTRNSQKMEMKLNLYHFKEQQHIKQQNRMHAMYLYVRLMYVYDDDTARKRA